MLFLTVGHQMPFDRLVRAVDEWSRQETYTAVFGQVGRGGYRPYHFDSVEQLPPEAFARRMEEADAIVSHAGMGTIITALRLGKPLLVLPRRAGLGETRNDHQVATARHFEEAGLVLSAEDEVAVPGMLNELLTDFLPSARITESASPQLIERLRRFVDEL